MMQMCRIADGERRPHACDAIEQPIAVRENVRAAGRAVSELEAAAGRAYRVLRRHVITTIEHANASRQKATIPDSRIGAAALLLLQRRHQLMTLRQRTDR